MRRELRTGLALIVPLLLAAKAAAQGFGPPPGQSPFPPAGTQAVPQQQAPAAAWPGQEPPCMKDFIPLREAAEKRALAIRAASERHASPKEACGLFNALVAAEGKVLKFAIANATSCGIPQQAIGQIKESHAHTTQLRGRICQAAANPQPSAPSLGDALGTSRVPDATNVKPGRGTFDTLTGTPLGGGTKKE